MKKIKKQRIRILVFSALLISIISISGIVAYAMQSVRIPTEVKEPLEILEYPTGFSLFPGETINFNFTIENLASVTYFQEFDFQVNDTDYQKYVSFSNYNYSIPPGTYKLDAWMTISPSAPAANFEITISKKTDTQNPTPTPPPINYSTTLNPSLELLAEGARWAAREGKAALYINIKDNYEAHSTTDGINWDWGTGDLDEKFAAYQDSVVSALKASGFEITLAGDIPEDLTKYDVVVIFAYYAVEPRHGSLIREYIYNGGSVVLLCATPAYLAAYSKSLSCTNSLELIEDWFGASHYSNNGGAVTLIEDNPLETSLSANDISFSSKLWSAGVSSLGSNTKIVGSWESGGVFAFTHEYGTGRVYYQAQLRNLE